MAKLSAHLSRRHLVDMTVLPNPALSAEAHALFHACGSLRRGSAFGH
jgi:hypothetical protein